MVGHKRRTTNLQLLHPLPPPIRARVSWDFSSRPCPSLSAPLRASLSSWPPTHSSAHTWVFLQSSTRATLSDRPDPSSRPPIAVPRCAQDRSPRAFPGGCKSLLRVPVCSKGTRGPKTSTTNTASHLSGTRVKFTGWEHRYQNFWWQEGSKQDVESGTWETRR